MEIQKHTDANTTYLHNIYATANIDKDNIKHRKGITAFIQFKTIIEVLPDIIAYSKGKILLSLWNKYGEQAVRDNRQLEVTEVIANVWKPAKKELEIIVKRLKDGDIKFREFDNICGTTAHDILKKELHMVDGGKNDQWIVVRIDQLKQYKNLQNYGKAAKVIIEVVQKFKLNGDFKPIQNILEMVSLYSNHFENVFSSIGYK